MLTRFAPTLKRTLTSSLKILTPPADLTVSQWADQKRMLSPEASAAPGRWSTGKAEYQRGIMDAFSDPLVEQVVIMSSAQIGKALALDTPIPTPTGWTTMGGLKVGDEVFDEKGHVCRVVFATPVMEGRPCYAVEFSDGACLVADAEHRWLVDYWSVKKGVQTRVSEVKTTKEMSVSPKRGGRFIYSIPLAAPIILGEVLLPVDPYVLGLWLGDGFSHRACLTGAHDDVAELASLVAACGYPAEVRRPSRGASLVWIGEKSDPGGFCSGVRGVLKNLGLLSKPGSGSSEKHVPELYLRASLGQRLSLLQGLMDSDGYVSADGSRCVFSNSNPRLADAMSELLLSLGLKFSRQDTRAYAVGDGGRRYGRKNTRLVFSAPKDLPVFRLHRKRVRHAGRKTTSPKVCRRSVVAVREVASVPVRCIQVDSPSHLYLAGRHFIPTHNTEILNNICGYFIDQDPSPMLVVQPTLDMGQAWSKDRLAPMLRDTPVLKGRIRDVKSRFSDNTILHKVFPGGHITVCGANSPSSLASRPVRVVLCDEVDRYPVSAGTEGDPVKLAWKRSTSFWNRKGLLCSTPTVKADPSMGSGSRIELAFEHSDKRFYHVPCPHCRHEQVMKWPQVQWPQGEPEHAQYYCEACGVAWTEAERRAAIKKGRWVATAPFHGVAGFHIWEAYSPFSSLPGIARAFLEAKKMPETLKTWVNTVLGESWEEAANKVEATPLMERREDYFPYVPEGVAVLTAGVDTQDDRLEVEVVGWGLDFETWNVDFRIFYGDPNKAEVWGQLLDYLRTPFDHALGRKMTISSTGVDTAGHCTDAAYRFCKTNEKYRVYAFKGVPEAGKPIAGRPSKRNKGKVKLFPIGVDAAKEVVYSRLRIEEPGPGYCHFPLERDQEYFDQLTAEKRITKYVNGRPKMVWTQTRKRNEALDCRVYATAAYTILKPSIPALLKKLKQLPPSIPTVKAVPNEAPRPVMLEEEKMPEAVLPQKRIARRRSGGFVQGW